MGCWDVDINSGGLSDGNGGGVCSDDSVPGARHGLAINSAGGRGGTGTDSVAGR